MGNLTEQQLWEQQQVLNGNAEAMATMGPAPIHSWTCPFCRMQGAPIDLARVSTFGWVLAVLLVFLCLPVFWLPLVYAKERARRCAHCGSIVGGWS